MELIACQCAGVLSRPSRPSPNAAPTDTLTTNEPQVTLTDAHYDRLEAILVEKIQNYVQNGELLFIEFFEKSIRLFSDEICF